VKRKFVLIFWFLCTVSAPVFSETYTIKFGDLPGGFEIKYEIKDSDNRIVGATGLSRKAAMAVNFSTA